MEIKLGLCNPPEPIYLYVRSGEEQGANYLWYKYDINSQKIIPVYEKGLCGNLLQLRLTSKEFKGKENMKLDIIVQADELYVIRTGVETNFAKTFLLAANQIKDLERTLIFSVVPGDENVVFCRLHDAPTKQRIKAEWDNAADWASIIFDIQSRLKQETSEFIKDTSFKAPLPQVPANNPVDVEKINDEIMSILQSKHITTDTARNLLNSWFGKTSRHQLSYTQLVDFKNRLACLKVDSGIDRNLLWQEIVSLGRRRNIDPSQFMFTKFGAYDIETMTDEQLLALKEALNACTPVSA